MLPYEEDGGTSYSSSFHSDMVSSSYRDSPELPTPLKSASKTDTESIKHYEPETKAASDNRNRRSLIRSSTQDTLPCIDSADSTTHTDAIQLEEKLPQDLSSRKKQRKRRLRWVRCCFPFARGNIGPEESTLHLTGYENQTNKYDGSNRSNAGRSTSGSTYQSGGMSRLAMQRQRERRNSQVEIFQEKNKNIVRYEDENGAHEEELGDPQPLIAQVSRNGTAARASRPVATSKHMQQEYLLPFAQSKGKKTLILDLDETLVHSSFKPVSSADYIIPIEIDGVEHKVYVCKRPGVDQFIEETAKDYELVVFTASLKKYADAVVDRLDPRGFVTSRLFREHCTIHNGNYVKDLARLGRELKNSIIIDNSPVSYYLQPENALPISSWFDDPRDTELIDMIPFLVQVSKADSVYSHLKNFARNSAASS